MKKILLAGVCAALITATPSLAADMAVKAPPVVAPVASWTGFYVGGNGGYGFGSDSGTEYAVSGAAFPRLTPGTPLYGGLQPFKLDPQGGLIGVQAGYNWQSSANWVLGIEADIQASDISANASCILACGTPLVTAPTPAILSRFPVLFSDNSYSEKLDWFGTVRGRVGYTNGPGLFYLTGGLAYGDVERSGSVTGATQNPNGTTRNTFTGFYGVSSTKVGWTVGAGGELKIASDPNWSVKAEYLYVDLGSNSDTFNTIFQPGGVPAAGVAATRTDTSSNHENILRIGLNYHFNQAVVAKY
jgi:outer membrane immunogenic protein